MYEIKKLLGAKIKTLRNKNNMTQEYLAEQIGISPRSLSFIESGKNYPCADTLDKICTTFNIEPYKLFLFPKEKSPKEIKHILINKINVDEDFALFLYDYAKQHISL